MAKETLTLADITHDLRIVADRKYSNQADGRLYYIVPITMLAIMIGLLLRSVWIGILIFLPAVYHIVLLIREYKEYRDTKKGILDGIERGEIGIAIEEMSHVSEESIYEPHYSTYRRFGSNRRMTKTIRCFNFMSGGRWRVPPIYRHYQWSREFYLSTEGLKNISVKGNKFYYVSLQADHDVAYIYPCKLFTLGEDLKKKSENS